MLICRSILLRLKNISDIWEKIKTHILCSIISFTKHCVVYDEMSQNMAEAGRPQMRIWRMRFACWISKATNTHSERIILTVCPWHTAATRRGLNVTLHLHCLSWLKNMKWACIDCTITFCSKCRDRSLRGILNRKSMWTSQITLKLWSMKCIAVLIFTTIRFLT